MRYPDKNFLFFLYESYAGGFVWYGLCLSLEIFY